MTVYFDSLNALKNKLQYTSIKQMNKYNCLWKCIQTDKKYSVY